MKQLCNMLLNLHYAKSQQTVILIMTQMQQKTLITLIIISDCFFGVFFFFGGGGAELALFTHAQFLAFAGILISQGPKSLVVWQLDNLCKMLFLCQISPGTALLVANGNFSKNLQSSKILRLTLQKQSKYDSFSVAFSGYFPFYCITIICL